MHPKRFVDRRDAGRVLAKRMAGGAHGNVVVLGLPRGGVVVAAEVALALAAPLDVLVVRKLGLPWQPELAMGAIAAVGDLVETVRAEAVLAAAQVDDETFTAVRDEELAELRRPCRRGRRADLSVGAEVVPGRRRGLHRLRVDQ